jgi:hypothetical protein
MRIYFNKKRILKNLDPKWDLKYGNPEIYNALYQRKDSWMIYNNNNSYIESLSMLTYIHIHICLIMVNF